MLTYLLVFVFAFLGLAVFVAILVSFVYARLVVRSHRQPLTISPRDYDLQYEDVEFTSSDGLLIKGWFIPGASKKTVVIGHPWPFNRHGFEPENQGIIKLFKVRVDMLKTAKAFHQEGYSILMFDFRNHGESERGITGIGVNEYQDALGALSYLETREDIDISHIGMVGFCMAGNAFMRLVTKSSIPKCLIAIQPVSIAISTKRFLQRLTGSSIASVIVWLMSKMCQLQGGYSFEEMSPLRVAPSIETPTLYIQAEGDPWGTVEDVRSFCDATPAPKELWIIEGTTERFDTYNYVGEHPERLIDFLNKYM